eukprot:TRINITY_DN4560_c0_g1_i4.p1 TRINITY_DN4560_c0_g1~~TRINITY_DN4560_c0_g1_i4.p1  ORF type:complete len:191 (-),score=-17.77 TRINITY_DN4560_c0_g1_i4:1083-1655(-)
MQSLFLCFFISKKIILLFMQATLSPPPPQKLQPRPTSHIQYNLQQEFKSLDEIFLSHILTHKCTNTHRTINILFILLAESKLTHKTLKTVQFCKITWDRKLLPTQALGDFFFFFFKKFYLTLNQQPIQGWKRKFIHVKIIQIFNILELLSLLLYYTPRHTQYYQVTQFCNLSFQTQKFLEKRPLCEPNCD